MVHHTKCMLNKGRPCTLLHPMQSLRLPAQPLGAAGGCTPTAPHTTHTRITHALHAQAPTQHPHSHHAYLGKNHAQQYKNKPLYPSYTQRNLLHILQELVELQLRRGPRGVLGVRLALGAQVAHREKVAAARIQLCVQLLLAHRHFSVVEPNLARKGARTRCIHYTRASSIADKRGAVAPPPYSYIRASLASLRRTLPFEVWRTTKFAED